MDGAVNTPLASRTPGPKNAARGALMGRRTRVMVVDDNALARNLLRRILESEGLLVCAEAKDGRQALDMLQESKPDMIVMDFMMPNQNGLQTAQEILKIAPSIPIVMNTLYSTDQLSEAAANVGVRKVVSKDNVDMLSKTLKSFLKSS